MKRSTLKWLGAAVLGLTSLAGQAQDAAGYPSKPVTLVVPTAAGGGTDTMARVFADRLGKALGQSFVVDNRPGANGLLGAENVLNGPADGSRLLFSYTAAMVVNPILLKTPPFDPVKDFAPIAQIGRGGNLFLVRKDLPVSTIQEFVAYAKARPGQLNYCSWGAGSGGHLAMEILMQQAGIKLTHIPYKGSAPCVQDLIGGQVDAAWSDVSSVTPFVQAGRVKALVSSTPSRLPQLQGVPTLNEAGYKFDAYAWYGLFAPAKTPPAIVAKLGDAMQAILKEPAVIQRMKELNFTDVPVLTPDQFKAQVAKDYRSWRELIQSIGLTLN